MKGLWLHVDGAAGAAGDMLLGAFLDLGVPPGVIEAALGALGEPGIALEQRRVVRGGVGAIKAEVLAGGDPTAPPYAHHEHEHEHHEHPHRHYRDIRALLEGAPLDARVRELAQDAFLRLARAEAKIHGTTVYDVAFHEVGALDAIGDVVASAAAVAWLAPAGVSASALEVGGGTVQSAHGRLPVPAPATLEILREVGAPVRRGGADVELLTPTGAAILAAVVTRWDGCPRMVDQAVGYGAGTRELPDRPNVVRIAAGRTGDAGRLLCLEANVDDMNPELWPDVLARLLEGGAADAWLTPIQMKKGRPAVLLGALVPEARREPLAELVLRQTTTLGLRWWPVERDVLEREVVEVDTSFGPVAVKVGRRKGAVWNVAPEHASVERVARDRGVPPKEVYQAALAAWLLSSRA